MIRAEDALINFGQLIGLMDGGGTVQFGWFLDPLNNALNGIPNNRQFLLKLVRALLGKDENGDKIFVVPGTTIIWEPIDVVQGTLQGGLLWNDDAQPLRLGVGSKITIGSNKQHLDVAVIARLLRFTAGNPFPQQVSTEFGQIQVAGVLPVPDFLDSANATASLDPTQPKVFNLGLDVKAPNKDPRHFDIPNQNVVWDCARLAIVVLRAWVSSHAGQSQGAGQPGGGSQQAGAGGFFNRVDSHFFPMLGADSQPGDAIQSFPLFNDQTGTTPSFTAWQNSLLNFSSNNGSGALTFLWHLRALITGSESKDLFSGSFYFPLVGADQPMPPPAGPLPGFPDFNSLGNYENTPHPSSIFLGITSEGVNTHTLVLDLHNAAGVRKRIPIASMNGSFSRPSLPKDQDWTDLINFVTGFNGFSAGASTIEVTNDAGALEITVLNRQEPPQPHDPIDGAYALQVILRSDNPVAFRVKTPLLDIEYPPDISADDQATLFIAIVNWTLSAAGPQDEDIKKVIDALLTMVSDSIKTGTVPDAFPLLKAVLGVLGNNNLLSVGPLSVAINDSSIEPTLTFGPFKPGDLGKMPIHIGKVSATAGVSTSNGSLTSAGVALYDLRFGEGAGAGEAGGLVGSLLPDMRQAPGFTLAVNLDFNKPNKVSVTGGGKIPLQETIGPLELAGLLIDLKDDRFLIGIDLSFKLAVISVSAYELGVEFPFNGAPTPFLHGLSLAMDIPAVKLAGMFAKIKNGNQEDYVGGAVVRVLNLFQLSAIGGYTQITGDPGKDSTPSLFIFASLVAPLGGPPWFFITGIAGGFGYNRSLPPPGLLTEHPFIQVMRGDLPLEGDMSSSLATLGTYFAAIKGQHWVAAGIQFTAFGFINGKLVVAIAFGNKFAVQVLGLAAFGIEHIAYFEIGIEASGNEEEFKLKAGLSKNSYLIHPDIASLSGDFALGIWHGGEHAGDFVFSIGGYHPYFQKPEHYDSLNRVAVRCTVYGFIRMTVECFFACTPKALMAGASVSLTAEFAGIGCGLDVYIDVYIRWDPFYLQARLGVALWFEFFGRHEIGVDLEIWTPPFGGIATIDLALVSFDVEFGADLHPPPPPKLFEFLNTHAQIPAKQDNNKAEIAAFNTDDAAGLFRIDFTEGRTTKPQADSPKQEGIGTPVPMATEFAFTAKTRLPLNYGMVTEPGVPAVQGKINVPLCELYGMGSNFFITFTNLDLSPKIEKYLKDLFPAAQFGDKVEAAQSAARQAVAGIETDKAALALWDGYSIRCEAKLSASPVAITAKSFEDSIGLEEEYPLPLSLPSGTPAPNAMPKAKYRLSTTAAFPVLQASGTTMSSRDHAELIVKNAKPLPLKILVLSADCQRFPISVRLRGLTVAAPPTGVPVIGVPSSPPRRAELLPVSLRKVAPKATTDLRRRRLNTLSKARNLTRRFLTPEAGMLESFKGVVNVKPGSVQLLELEGSQIKGQKLTFAGSQTVRAVFLGAGGDFVSETSVMGTRTVVPPADVRCVALFGEGTQPAIAVIPGAAGPGVLLAQENVGIEHDTTLTALAGRTFAAHGCILELRSRSKFTATPLDAIPGFEVLRRATRFTVSFPFAGQNASLVLTVAPVGADPGSALDQVRWYSAGATLAELTTVVGPESTAFVMNVRSDGPWSLEIDLGTKWRLTQVVQCRQTARDSVNQLKARIDQDLIDDRFYKPAETVPASTVTLEVTQ
jgi:hypothetical protein